MSKETMYSENPRVPEIIGRFLTHPRWALKFFYQVLLIRRSKLFDASHYLAQIANAARVRHALLHYVYFAVRLEADPSRYFDTHFYVSQRSYIRSVIERFQISPLYHYVRFGIDEQLNPNESFNTRFYYCSNPDVRKSDLHPLLHFIRFGKSEGRAPLPPEGIPASVWQCAQGSRSDSVIRRLFRSIPVLMARDPEIAAYMRWRSRAYPQAHDLASQRSSNFGYRPTVSVVMPVYRPKLRFLREAIQSVIRQTYSNWELCVSDCSSDSAIARLLCRWSRSDERIKVRFSEQQMHISENSNAALDLSKGELIGFLDHDDMLTPHALFEIVKYRQDNPECDIIYSDEDKISENSRYHFSPFFKPDWSPDTFLSHNYTCHFTVYDRALLRIVGGLRKEFDGSQDYDLMLRASEKARKIGHVPHVLYYWRVHKSSVAKGLEAKNYAALAAKNARIDALRRRGIKATLVPYDQMAGQYHVDYDVVGNPLVSIIIPTRNQGAVLEKCIISIAKRTHHRAVEIIIVDNNSDDQESLDYLSRLVDTGVATVLRYTKPFNFSAINNFAVSSARGDYLLFLNNDTEVITDGWVTKLLGHAQQPHVGAVGCQMLFPGSNAIQHCGVINLGPGPNHAFYGKRADEVHYFGRNALDNNWLAVTGACLMLSRAKFDEVAGFGNRLTVGYNDVDLCFRLYKRGYFNVCRNSVRLIHYESFSRGNDQTDRTKSCRLAEELALLNWKHPEFVRHDPFFNPNLSYERTDFVLSPIDVN